MVAFADTRTSLDRQRIAGLRAGGVDARYTAGEFAANEVSMACSTSRHVAQRVIAMTRRVRAEAPDAWDAWVAGDIDQDKVERINRALRRLQRERSKVLLNALVVDVAICKTPEILGRWLNQFILETEKDLQDERLQRSVADRYVSVRPDLDGMSFLTAELSAVDAHAIDQVLTAVAGIAEPGDPRTLQQRRADALVDVLLGRVSNGCHVVWDTNTDVDDHLDDPDPGGESDPDPDGHDACPGEPDTAAPGHTTGPGDGAIGDGQDHDKQDRGGRDCGGLDGDDGDDDGDGDGDGHRADDNDGTVNDVADSIGEPAAEAWDANDWDQPASVFRPDHRTEIPDPDNPGNPASTEKPLATNGSRIGTYPPGRTRITPCPGDGHPRPLPVTIGIVITAQSLFGFSNTPGQLMDRSTLIPADRIRELAQQRGTLFHRLLTDDNGNLLDVTELGRFPSRKLALAVKFRDGTCTGPTCTTPAIRCDIDHVIPVPEGPTTAGNLNDNCRHEHRAKTHAGHQSARTGPHTTEWVTPTGHKYTSTDQPFSVEEWPRDDDPQQE